MPGVEERVTGSRLQSSGCTISTTVATLILRPISSQLPGGTGTLGEPVITIPFRTYSCAAGNYSVCPFEASTGLSGVSQPLPCEMVE